MTKNLRKNKVNRDLLCLKIWLDRNNNWLFKYDKTWLDSKIDEICIRYLKRRKSLREREKIKIKVEGGERGGCVVFLVLVEVIISHVSFCLLLFF